MKTKFKINDQVVVTSGADRGKRGKVLYIDQKKGRVVVEGVNKKSKFVRPTQENPKGGVMTREYPVNISNIMIFCAKCKKGVRIKTVGEQGKDKTRNCSKCEKSLD